MKLTEKLNALYEAEAPKGELKFLSWTGESDALKDAKGSIGSFRKDGSKGWDFSGDPENIYILKPKSVKKEGKKVIVTDSRNIAYTFEVA